MTEPATFPPLRAVAGGDLPAPPYPSDTRAAGWMFYLDTTRIEASDTWMLARPEVRPWLLMLWMRSWTQSPAGSLPADDALIQTLIGIDAAMWSAHRAILMRGWALHDDGRLYHPVLTEQVIKMIESRAGARERVKRHREQVTLGVTPKATRLPRNWTLPDEWKQWAVDVHHLDPMRVVRISLAFRDYWISQGGSKACKLDWAATWRNWIRKECGD